MLEEYGPDIEYIKGEKNLVADAISRFPLNGKWRYYTEVHPSKLNSVRNQLHWRTTWMYFSYYFNIDSKISTDGTYHNS